MLLPWLICLQAVFGETRLGITATVVRERSSAVYDFIIVGGGASGLTVADRLTEDPSVSVLVLEAGPFDSHEPNVTVPGLLDLTDTPYWFPLWSANLPGLDNRSFQATAGRGVGGGTLINGLFFDRGGAPDYDAWGELGNPGWSWVELLPYFRKSETFSPPTSEFVSEWAISWNLDVHGSAGPVDSSYPTYQYPHVKNFLRAWNALGIYGPADPTAGIKAGVFLNPSSQDYISQTRSYARSAHYDPVIKKRSNYHILPLSVVTKIVFENGAAAGVEYMSRTDNTSTSARVSKEVIIAAGGYNSPKILQHSGIGPNNVLAKQGIELISDLPVGYNLQDHPSYYAAYHYSTPIFPTPDDMMVNQTLREQSLALYHEKREGPFTVVNLGGNSVCFLPLSEVTTVSSILDLARSADAASIYPSDTSQQVLDGYAAQQRILTQNLLSNATSVQETAFGGGSVIPVTLVRPFSRGTVFINNTNPLVQASIDYGTFTAPSDIAIMVAAIRKNREMMATAPMKIELGATERLPGANITSDEDLEAAIRQQASPTFQHGCCTCPMMPEELGGVVDPRLRVYGISGLRIIDASIMPIIPGSHTSATVYAVAEKAADLIKEDYGLQRPKV